jgi:hypothetical protein
VFTDAARFAEQNVARHVIGPERSAAAFGATKPVRALAGSTGAYRGSAVRDVEQATGRTIEQHALVRPPDGQPTRVIVRDGRFVHERVPAARTRPPKQRQPRPPATRATPPKRSVPGPVKVPSRRGKRRR